MLSIRDQTVERGDKLTLEKAISMGRSSEAQWWAQKGKTVRIRGIDRHQVWIHGRRNVNFVVLLTSGDLFLLLENYADTTWKRPFDECLQNNNARFWEKNFTCLTFPFKTSSECLTQDDWHTSLKLLALKWILNWTQGLIALLFPSPCLLDSQFCRNRPTSAKFKLYDAHRITPTGKVSLACE